MACFRCPGCGRRHVVRPLDVEEGGRCPCGARFVVSPARDETGQRTGHGDETGLFTWAVEPDGSVYEVRVEAYRP